MTLPGNVIKVSYSAMQEYIDWLIDSSCNADSSLSCAFWLNNLEAIFLPEWLCFTRTLNVVSSITHGRKKRCSGISWEILKYLPRDKPMKDEEKIIFLSQIISVTFIIFLINIHSPNWSLLSFGFARLNLFSNLLFS